MARVKRAVNAHKKRRTTLERASGYRGQRSRLYRKAKEQVTHSLVYSYRDRKARKGDFRKLWIQRINAAARANGMTYNRFIQGLHLAGVEVDRKILADLAVNDAPAFAVLVETAKAALPEDVNASSRGQGLRLTTPSAAPDPGQRPRQGGAEAQPPLGTHRAAALPCRRPEGRRGRARGRRAAWSRCSPPSRPRERYAALRAPPAPAWAVVDDRALASLSDSVTPAGVVAVCRFLDVRDVAGRGGRWRTTRAASGRHLRRRPRPRQRRHGDPHRRRGRRRRRRAGRQQRRRLQPQDRPGERRQPVPPARGGRARRRRRRRGRAGAPG